MVDALLAAGLMPATGRPSYPEIASVFGRDHTTTMQCVVRAAGDAELTERAQRAVASVRQHMAHGAPPAGCAT